MLDPRRIALVLVLLALAATVLVALALPELRLHPGTPLPAVAHGAFLLAGGSRAPEVAMPLDRTVLVLLALGLGLGLLEALWRALRGTRLQSLLSHLFRCLGIVVCVGAAVLLVGMLARPGPPGSAGLRPTPPRPAERTPLGPPPAPLLWIIAAGVVFTSAVAAAFLLRPPRPIPEPLLARLALEAERARAALAAGEDARAVILACYTRMTAAVAEGRGIERPGPMTAREFGERLGAMGLPRAPVLELTALFERCRYGGRAATAAEESRALACLTPIVEHCRGARRGGAR